MYRPYASALADALLSGPWTRREMSARGREAIGARTFVPVIVRRVLARYPEPPWTERWALVALILELPSLARAHRRGLLRLAWPALPPHEMGEPQFGVPALPTTGDLAAWLGVEVDRLAWFADRRNLLRAQPEGPLQHYVSRWVPKRSGGLRLLESPKPWLKQIQRRILREILDRVPPHPAAFGFRAGRGVVDFARPHAGREVVIRLDLRDFFPATYAARVRRVFAWLGYPDEVAAVLAALCTTRAPLAVRARAPVGPDRFAAVRRLASAHLPQGAPTSPALANLCAYPLDVRLSAAAASMGATYTRYADDLAFSGDGPFAERARWFAAWAAGICLDEGYPPNLHKLRIMGQGQRQELAGVGVNVHPNVRRADYDRLKAALHRWEHGAAPSPEEQARLLGQISWVAQRNPARGSKLRARYDALTSRG